MTKRKPLNDKIRQAVVARDGSVCQICGSKLDTTGREVDEMTNRAIVKYHIDHIKLVREGGTDEMSNLRLSCVPCNLVRNCKHGRYSGNAMIRPLPPR